MPAALAHARTVATSVTAEGTGSLAEALERSRASMERIAFGLLGQQQDAEDAVQEAMVRAMSRLANFRGDSKLDTWLTGIVINAAREIRRSGMRRSQRVRHVAEPPEFPTEHFSPAAAAEQSERARHVHRALLELPEHYREPVILRDLKGLSYAEIAEALGIPIGTVKSRIHAASVMLIKLLTHLNPDHAPGTDDDPNQTP
jgi:RNA polymerase sigma-70 factor (ECF subfamily)